jgi:tetratricopeptide (TPR) repeat protein
MTITYVTGVDARMFASAAILLEAFRSAGEGETLLVADFGLSEAQRAVLREKHVLLERPASVAADTHPFLLKTALLDFLADRPIDVLVWLDADMMPVDLVHSALSRLVAEMESRGEQVAAAPCGVHPHIADFVGSWQARGQDLAPFLRLLDEYRVPADAPYLNAGFFVCRSAEFLVEWRAVTESTARHLVFDQNVFNALLHAGRWKTRIVPPAWNLHGNQLADVDVRPGEGGSRELYYGQQRVRLLHATSQGEHHERVQFRAAVLGRRFSGRVKLFRHELLRAWQLGHLQQFLEREAALLDRGGLLESGGTAAQEAAWLTNAGVQFAREGRRREALAHFERAVSLGPHIPEIHANLAGEFRYRGELDRAVEAYRTALRLKPDFVGVYADLGLVFRAQGKFDAAEACYRRALRLDGDCAEAHYGRGDLLLLQGDFEEGWREYAWRLRCPQFCVQRLPQPAWDGGALAGRTILLHAEQGLGDTLQFIRYAPQVKARGGTVLVQCQRPLLDQLADFPGVDALVPLGTTPPPFDVQASLLSLPGLLGTSAETIPADVPYLAARRELVETWRERLGNHDDFRVGIAWQGSRRHPWDFLRSVPLEQFAALAEIPRVRLFALHHDVPQGELPIGRSGHVHCFGDTLDFVNTTALIAHLDLVITCDTALVHLAGALGARTWLATSFAPDWRWLLDRADSPWYPTLRLFRQPAFGAWSPVFAEMAHELSRIS